MEHTTSPILKDQEQLSTLFEKAGELSLSYLMQIGNIPTTSGAPIPAVRQLHKEGNGTIPALAEFQDRFGDSLVASTGPRYWGFVTGGSTPASIVGDWLASVYDQNPQALTGQGDVSARIEVETVSLLLDLLGLPPSFSGGFVTGATMSNFTCLAVARQWLGRKHRQDIAREGLAGLNQLNILSATPHSSAIKALAMLGIGSNKVIAVDTMGGEREAIDLASLESMATKLNGAPFILISSAGTVNSGDFDDFTAIAKLREKFDFWWHIDAAFGAFAACSPKHDHLLANWENADSITVDGHKWLNVPYENAVYFIKKEHHKLQVESFQNSNAPYLGDLTENFSFLNVLPENSRRLRALPVWFGLVAYGRKGYREIVENCIRLAKELGEIIEGHEAFELVLPVHLNIVAFTLKNVEDALIEQFLTLINSRGKVFMTPLSFRGRKGIRAALVNWRTTDADLQIVKDELEAVWVQLKVGQKTAGKQL
jgi:glutamate/tyrosine decarboxylase-like PLP-dependent enzyme